MAILRKVKLSLSHDKQVLNLTLASEKGNILDGDMMSELTRAAEQEGGQPSVKALVFRGEGKDFCFGASVPEHQKEFVAQMLTAFHTLLRALIETAKPMFSVVQGQCLGGGLELAAFCHWIFAAEEAMFGQPEIKLGVFPPVACLVLPHRIGQSAADDLILSGRSLTAPAARTLGLVHSVSSDPESQLEAFMQAHILPRSAAALNWTVRASRFEMHQAFLKNITAIEKMYVDDLMASSDANEGIAAFMEKRKPVWKNR